MKRYSTALLFGLLSLTSQLAHADIVDDAIGNIQQAINDAYNPSSSRSNDDDDRRRRQLEDRRRRLDERQRQLDDDRRRLEEDERRLEDDYDRG
ncbi:MAG: DDRRRQL repeat protein YjdP [Enterobacter sp.]|uniref:DDRRRQL repeat protein YjdP n=1 Tax=Enterobacter sp. TaxID=42895 RepID=UPI0029089EAF|nr:DDRRRQL repeat protein YjdP [Enterobacter sp.]MDU7155698.1 DDRRRQL repeat protein YjdP [Enterobacter sp.]